MIVIEVIILFNEKNFFNKKKDKKYITIVINTIQTKNKIHFDLKKNGKKMLTVFTSFLEEFFWCHPVENHNKENEYYKNERYK